MSCFTRRAAINFTQAKKVHLSTQKVAMTSCDLRCIVVGLLFYVVVFTIMALTVGSTADPAPGPWLLSMVGNLVSH